MLRTGARYALRATSVGAVGVAGYYGLTDDGFKRNVIFWGRAFPIYVDYRVTEFRVKKKSDAEQAAAFNKLHDKHAKDVYNLVLSLRGFYMKLAQIVSTRDDLVPQQYMQFLKSFQDDVPSQYTAEQVERMICDSLGIQNIHDVFDSFDPKPVGAASIGQAHRATLKSSPKFIENGDGTAKRELKFAGGEDVVVKLQYPDAEQLFRNDIKTILSFCTIAMPFHVPAIREIEKQFKYEFDYRLEAENLQKVRDRVLPEWSQKVDIPKPYTDLCTKSVLVMEYLPGVKMIDGIRDQFRRFAAKEGLTLEEYEAIQKEKIRTGEIKIPSAARVRFYTKYLYIRDVIWNIPTMIANLFRRQPVAFKWTEPPINLPSIMDLLLKVHGYEVFIAGAFNGDPHPGNVLLMPDGRLGLIDYGQVKEMSLPDRLTYAKLILAMCRRDEPEIVRLFTEEIGVRTQNTMHDVIVKMAYFWHDRDTDDVTGGLNVQLFMEAMQEKDPVIDLPDEFVLVARVNMLLRGVGNAFQMKLRVADAWKIFAEQLLRKEGIKY